MTHYTIENEVGRGGAGRVFLAYDGNIGREVAIKEVSIPEELSGDVRDRRLKRFIREAKLTGQLEHPSVVPIYDFGMRPDGTTYYVMKYVRGDTLLRAVRECGDPSSEEAFAARMKLLGRIIAVCEAMAYAHAKGVIHRDLKPGNIVLGEFGETIILDWGLAKKITEPDLAVDSDERILEQSFSDDLTKQGALLGTPSYMAPEQADSGLGPVDQQSDVYSLGALLFYILTGEKIYPHGAQDALDRLRNEEPTPSPLNRLKFIPPELAAICQKATAKDKEQRFKDAGEMAEQLKAYRDGRLVSVYAYSRGELFRRFVARNRTATIAVAALVAAIIAGAGFSVNFAVDAEHARQRAERALVDISTISEDAMSLARNAAETLKPYVDTFSESMVKAADRLSRLSLDRSADLRTVLERLNKEHKGISSFAVLKPSLHVAASLPEGFGQKLDNAILLGERIDRVFDQKSVLLGHAVIIDGVHMFAIAAPIIKRGRVEAALVAFIRIKDVLPVAFGFDPKESPFQVWCMQDDGYILYDEDSGQIGKELFTDAMYQKFPELLEFGKRMQIEPWGSGYYSFFERGGERIVYKIAAWDTVRFSGNVSWKMVVTHPYVVEK